MGPERTTMKPNITREQQKLKSRSNALHVSIQKTIENVTMHCNHVAMLSDVKGDENLSISDAECCTHKALLTQ